MAAADPTPQCPTGTPRAAVVAAAVGLLDAYVAAWVAAPPELPEDAGPAVLATLVAGTPYPAACWHASRALTVWCHGFHRGTPQRGLYRGQAGYVAGLACAAALRRADGLVEREAQALSERWAGEPVAAGEYGLVDGVSGGLLALACTRSPEPRQVLAVARRLTVVRDWPAAMPAGLGYGVAGVAAALRAAYDVAGPVGEIAGALRRACDRILQYSTVDNGVLPATGTGWAAGTPGIAWALWEAGRALDDPGLQRVAVRAMDSCCAELLARPVPGLTVRDGAAGTLAVADAFARHAGLPIAHQVRDRLTGQLVDRLAEVSALAGGPMLLDGAGGVLAVLLTVAGGDRRWLTQYGLR